MNVRTPPAPVHCREPRAPRWRFRQVLGWFEILMALAGTPRSAPAQTRPIRFAFSKVLFLGVNENDARAAIKIYAESIAADAGLRVAGTPTLLTGVDAMAAALGRGEFDLISLSTPEYDALEARGLGGPIMLTRVGKSHAEELVLLTHQRNERRQIADLSGASLLIQEDTRTTLAQTWLDLVCHGAQMPPPDRTFGKVTRTAKPIHAILPVFFGKSDACLVTRSAWETMGELNPQVKTQLRVLAASPPIVPILTCFRRDCPEDLKERVIAVAVSSDSKLAFQQIMALFKTESLMRESVSALDGTRELIRAHRRLGDPAGNPSPPLTTTSSSP